MDSNQCSANSIGLTPHCGAQTFEFEKAADENSSTGGHRWLSPIDVSHLGDTDLRHIEAQQKTMTTARVVIVFAWSVLDSNQ